MRRAASEHVDVASSDTTSRTNRFSMLAIVSTPPV